MVSISVPQGSVVSQSVIDQAYNELLRQTEEFLVELHSRQEQQRIEEEEAEKMRKIKEGQVKTTVSESDDVIMMSLVCATVYRNVSDVVVKRRLPGFASFRRRWRERERGKRRRREGESKRKKRGESESFRQNGLLEHL